MKILKLIKCATAALVAAFLFITPLSAAAVTVVQAPSVTVNCHHAHCGCSPMGLLAKISGKSIEELERSYPQQTAWQVAKAMGKLNTLKAAYLTQARTGIDRIISDKRIIAQDGKKLYADLQKRVAAIDGVNIVIVGRTNFKPEC